MITSGPAEAYKLFPSVLAIKGNTLIVSKAGNMTTMLDATFKQTKTKVDVVVGSRPNVKWAKFMFTEDSTSAPKYAAAAAPRSK